ncbi:hypothetical protein KBD75_04115 [Candidatus Woesebacteria bacterium]|nr:hypothetical protein [Candidatus Woesebacteria bacterium]
MTNLSCYEDATRVVGVDGRGVCLFGDEAAVFYLMMIDNASSLNIEGVVKSGNCMGSCRRGQCPIKPQLDIEVD